jgi:hypothetical protein
MDKSIKEQWVAALRSGQYKQASGALKCLDSYCCLGVLSDLYCKATNKDWDNLVFNGHELLPTEVQEWAGLTDDDIEISFEEGHILNEGSGGRTLSGLNDSGLDFCQIANLIEQRVQ